MSIITHITHITQNSGKKLLAETRDMMRRLHYSIHTERAYCDWIARFVRFHHLRAREALFVGAEHKVEDFLSHLAVQGKVAASTQNLCSERSERKMRPS